MSPPRCQCHMDVVVEQPMQGPGHIRTIELHDAIDFEALKIHSLLYISNRYELSRVARLQEKKDRQEQVSRYSGISMAKMNSVGIWASCLVASWPQ